MNDEQALKLYRLIKDDMDGLEKRMNSRFDAVGQQIDDVRGHIDHLYGPIYKPSGGIQLNSQDVGYYFIVALGNSQLE